MKSEKWNEDVALTQIKRLTWIFHHSESDCRATGPVASRKEWQAGRLPYNSRKQRVERLSDGKKFELKDRIKNKPRINTNFHR